MARGDRQVPAEKQAPPERPAAPAIEMHGYMETNMGGGGPAVDALLQKAAALENEASIAERNVTRYRQSADDSEAFATRCRAEAQVCRDAIVRISN